MLTEAPTPPAPTPPPEARIAPADPRPHAVVIGAGFGGLAAGVRLGARGYRVTVVEALDGPGGRAYAYRQNGFTFDAGPTIITLPFLFEELWEMAGKRMSDHVRLVQTDPFYRLMFDDGSHFECSGDPARMRAEVQRLSPGDVRGYDAFLRESEKIYRFAFEELGQIPFSTFAPMIKAGPRFALNRAEQSVFRFASNTFKDHRLKIAFSFHPLFIGANPMDATRLYALVSYLEGRWGVHFAMGGTNALVRGLVDLIEGQGGRVVCNAPADEIIVRDGRACGVRLKSGETLEAAVVVSNVDAPITYRKLLRNHPRKRWTDARLERARYSMSLVVWYFGTKRRYENVAHHTILLGPRYEGLLKDIFHKKILADDFSLYLHRPTATDPSLAPDGCDSFYVLSPVPNLEADLDWTTLAEPYRQRIEAHLQERLLPDLKNQIVASHLVTPLDFEGRLNSYKGAAFSLEPVILQSAWFRPHNQSEEVDGLYLVGAGSHPGAGVPGVLSSARILDQLIPHGSTVHA